MTTTNLYSGNPGNILSSIQPQPDEHWPTFEEILHRLHGAGIYIHPDQLAEFMLAHGLPVSLCYVPAHLREKAIKVNKNYQGDMARPREEPDDQSYQFPWLN